MSHTREVLKKLIDKTAEFVADEGWEFDPWLAIVINLEFQDPKQTWRYVSTIFQAIFWVVYPLTQPYKHRPDIR